MTPEQEQELLDQVARAIQQQAQAAFDDLIERLKARETPREAMAAVTATFTGQYYQELSAAFSTLLERSIGVKDIKAWPVGGLDLSRRLYRHTAEVNAVTRQLIANHAKGMVQARELAMQIYEGYRFKVDPLQVKAKLPKYLREALRDPALDDGFARIIASIRVNQLKTPALKAGYLQLLDALEQNAGMARIKNLARTAWYERNRYFANRIAQTELHRAYSDQVAQELMADEGVVWVKYQMSRTHKVRDICDRHAGLNAWGKGPGVYPKAQAPKPPSHPFCRCVCRMAPEIEGEPGNPLPDAEARFMNRLDEREQRLIAGSRARLEAFRNGRSLESIYNAGQKPLYRWAKVGDGVNLPKQLEAPAILDGDERDSELLRFVEDARLEKVDRRITLSPVHNEDVLFVADAIGKDIRGYARTLESSAVRHVFKKHGNLAQEAKRQQIAVQNQDFLMLQTITKFGTKSIGDRLNRGSQTMVTEYAINGVRYHMVESIRNGNVTLVTLRKHKT